ncbi:MAG: hypothetical protein RR364_04760, partial [Lachnospiraceae bacterium]
MSQDGQRMRTENKDIGDLQIIFSSLVVGIAFLLDLYIMITDPKNYVLLGIISLVILWGLYILISGRMKKHMREKQREEEQYDNIFKSEKASYLMLKKHFTEMEDILSELEEKLDSPVEEILNAQKGIAKISISRGKENADALMNSNDRLLDKLSDYEHLLKNTAESVIDQQRNALDQGNRDLFTKQQEILTLLKETELSIRNELLNTTHKLVSQQPVMMTAPQPMQYIEQPVQPEPEPIPEP